MGEGKAREGGRGERERKEVVHVHVSMTCFSK